MKNYYKHCNQNKPFMRAERKGWKWRTYETDYVANKAYNLSDGRV